MARTRHAITYGRTRWNSDLTLPNRIASDATSLIPRIRSALDAFEMHGYFDALSAFWAKTELLYYVDANWTLLGFDIPKQECFLKRVNDTDVVNAFSAFWMRNRSETLGKARVKRVLLWETDFGTPGLARVERVFG